MSAYTLDYLARLFTWAFALCLSEGVLLTVSWLLCSRALRRAGAARRHRLACAHFAGFAALPALSLVALQWSLARAAEGASMATGRPYPIPIDDALGWMALLAGVWLVGALVCGIRLIDAWRATSRLEQATAPAALIAAVARLAASAGFARPPAVAVAAVSAPQVVGWRRPVLLLPGDVGARLTPRQLDAVLLHELAHIRCGDYGWNLLQRALLVLIWFHPGAWVMHTRLRCERELRCDDLAVRRCGSGADLAMALVRLAEPWPTRSVPLAQSAASGELTTRVVRLVAPIQPSRSWAVVLPVAIAAGLCGVALQLGAAGREDAGLRVLYQASAFGPGVLIKASDPAGVFQLRIRGDQVVAGSVGPGATPAKVVQRGPAVTLIDRSGAPVVAVTLVAEGRFEWRARPPAPAA